MLEPGQRIGYKGPSFLGMIGLLGVAILIVLAGVLLLWLRLWPFVQANSVGNDQVCQIGHHVDGSTTQGQCFNLPTPTPK